MKKLVILASFFLGLSLWAYNANDPNLRRGQVGATETQGKFQPNNSRFSEHSAAQVSQYAEMILNSAKQKKNAASPPDKNGTAR